MKPRILLADDHRLMLEGLQKLLHGHVDVVGAVEDGLAMLESAKKTHPDVVLLDISMPVMNGLEAARRLIVQQPNSKIIFLTMHADPIYVSEAFRAGGVGYVLKRSAATELIQAIQAVMKGSHYVTPVVIKEAARALVEAAEKNKPRPDLTPELRRVLDLVAEGLSATEISAELDISLKAAVNYLAEIVDMLDLNGRPVAWGTS